MEGDQAVTQRPVLYWLLHDHAGFVDETQIQDYTSRITFSVKMTVLIYSNSSSLVRISFIGLLRVFFSMAHTPTTTCREELNREKVNQKSCKHRRCTHRSFLSQVTLELRYGQKLGKSYSVTLTKENKD